MRHSQRPGTEGRIRKARNAYALELAQEAEHERMSFEEAVLAMSDDDVDPVAEFRRLMGIERDLNPEGKSRYRK